MDVRLVGRDQQIEAVADTATRQLVADATGSPEHQGPLMCVHGCSSLDESSKACAAQRR
jgi:hypothetical protein